MWSQAQGRAGWGGAESSRNWGCLWSPNSQTTSGWNTTHAHSVQREKIFLLRPKHWSLSFPPPKMHNSWDLHFLASAGIFSGNNCGAGGFTFPGFPRKLSRTWAQMVKGGGLVLAGPPTQQLTLGKSYVLQNGGKTDLPSGVLLVVLQKSMSFKQPWEAPPGLCCRTELPSHAHWLMAVVTTTTELPHQPSCQD